MEIVISSSPVHNGEVYQDEAMLNYKKLYKVSSDKIGERPHCHIGAILFEARYKEGKGSGILISPDLVLTAAHNVFSWTN